MTARRRHPPSPFARPDGSCLGRRPDDDDADEPAPPARPETRLAGRSPDSVRDATDRKPDTGGEDVAPRPANPTPTT